MKDRKPMVTIGLPFYNNEDTLTYTLRSIFDQSYTDWTLILINDGSTDGSCALIDEAILNDSRVLYINDPENRGLVYRLNQIAALCDTPYLARMDSDDLMMPQRIEVQLNYLIDHPDVDLLDSAMYSIDENYQVLGVRGLNMINRDPKSIVTSSALNHATIMGKAEWFKKNMYDPAYLRAEDYELWCRTSAFSNFDRIRLPLYIVREGNVNVKNYATTMKTCRRVLNVYGRDLLSERERVVEIFKTYAKTALYMVFGTFNLQGFLTKRRNNDLDKIEVLQLEEIVGNIIGKK